MKKTEKILGGFLLVLLFCGAVLLFFNNFQPKEDEEETQKKELSIKTPKQIFELGEDAEIGDMIYNVSEAELTEDYEKIDGYYKEQKYILSPYEYIKTVGRHSEYYDTFPGDVRFFRVKYSVTNNGDAKSEFSPDSLYVTSITGGEMTKWDFEMYDVRATSEDEKKEIELKGKRRGEDKNADQIYILSPGETIEIEVVGEFCIFTSYLMSSSKIWDSELDQYDLYLMKNSSTQRIHLDIAGSFGNGTDSYAQIREIQKMKYENCTNLERKKWREDWAEEQGFSSGSKLDNIEKIAESSEPGQRCVDIYKETSGPEGELVSGFCIETILEDFQIIQWQELPAVYTEQGNMKGMAERYQRVYGYSEEELKVLLLDVTFTSSEIGELEPYQKKMINYFYERSDLYTKDGDMLYCFGQADDWTVISDSKHPENTGPINFIQMEPDEVINVQMAYILPPALYEEWDALYFTGAIHNWKITSLTRIELK